MKTLLANVVSCYIWYLLVEIDKSYLIWVMIFVYGIVNLGPFLYKKIQQSNAGRKSKKTEERKRELEEIVKNVVKELKESEKKTMVELL